MTERVSDVELAEMVAVAESMRGPLLREERLALDLAAERTARLAADARATLAEAALAETREALKPFANEWNENWAPEQNAGHQISDDEYLNAGGCSDLQVGDLRRAARHAAATPATPATPADGDAS